MDTHYNQLHTACTHASPKTRSSLSQHHCLHKRVFQYFASNVISSQYKDHSLGVLNTDLPPRGEGIYFILFYFLIISTKPSF